MVSLPIVEKALGWLFDNRKAREMVTIKALRKRGSVITWCYDSPRQCSKFWKELCETGMAPDDGSPLERAAYFEGESLSAKKMWERGVGESTAMPSDT